MGNEVKYLSGTMGVTNKIKQAMYDVARQFVYIGFLLWEVDHLGYYREGGYKDVFEYAAAELNLKKTSVKNFIAINETFGSYRPQDRFGYNMPLKRSMSLQPEYEQFNYSQLTEMLSMSPDQRQQVKPDMSIREIRDLKKSLNSEPVEIIDVEPVPVEIDGQTSDQISDGVAVSGQTSDQQNNEDLLELLCDEYCRWPEVYSVMADDENVERLLQKCDKCPFAALWAGDFSAEDPELGEVTPK